MELLPVTDQSTNLYYTAESPRLFVYQDAIVNPSADSFKRRHRDPEIISRVDELFKDTSAYDGPTVFHPRLIEGVPIVEVYYCAICSFAKRRKRDVKKHIKEEHNSTIHPVRGEGQQIPRSYKKEYNYLVKSEDSWLRKVVSRASHIPPARSVAIGSASGDKLKERLDSFEQSVNQELNRMEYTLSSIQNTLASIHNRLALLESKDAPVTGR